MALDQNAFVCCHKYWLKTHGYLVLISVTNINLGLIVVALVDTAADVLEKQLPLFLYVRKFCLLALV